MTLGLKTEETKDFHQPVRILSFESRRAEEMKSLIERNGGAPVIAPSMREIPLEDNPQAFSFGEELFSGRIDIVIFMTGVGATALFDTLETRWPRDAIREELAKCSVVVRGPKPVTVLAKLGIRIDLRVPEPNTWRELIETIDSAFPAGSSNGLSGKRIAIQEYGKPNERLYDELRQRGASVTPVPVYRWALPEDTEPLRRAIRETIAGQFDLILFTSAQQLHNVISVAEEDGLGKTWLETANRLTIGSIGPTASETLREAGLKVDLEPTHPKMGPLIKESIEFVRGLRSGQAHN